MYGKLDFCVQCMVYIKVVKVHYTRRYRRSVGGAQSINREVGAKGSVKQNRGSTNRNLILRLHKWMRLQNKLKS